MRKAMIALLLLAVTALAFGMIRLSEEDEWETAQNEESAQMREPVAKVSTQGVNGRMLVDKESLYAEYDPVDPVCFYVTVMGGSEADGTNNTLEQVNSYLNLQGMYGVEKIYSEVIFQVGDETGPLPGAVGYDATGANGTINVRGRTSTGYPQKSYRISLYDTAGLWRGQRAIALNKHPADVTRLRNQIYFELLQDVTGLTSLRTQYVHLYVKDKTDPDAPDAFVDYGLYTQIELPNGRFLRNHGLSQNGNLYKANMCEMFRYEDQLRLATDPMYDYEAFCEVLEPKTSDDHSKLLEMLDAVNDYTIPIDEVLSKYFNLENLTGYMAFNMLMANPDSDAQNYLLYSPVNSDTWYYICWDGDGALQYYEDVLLENAYSEPEWTHGVSNYWGVVLFNRLLRTPSFREALKEKVEQLHEVISPERIAELIAKYRQTADQFTTVMPDAVNMKVTREQQEMIYRNMPYDTDTAYEYIMHSFEQPMPFYLGDARVDGGVLALEWDAAYDFDSEFVRYDVQVATDWDFADEKIIFQSRGQLDTMAYCALPQADTYYWRVTARNESGYEQIAFDQVNTSTGAHGGMRCFVIDEDGQVINH